jgi:Terminase large subunit, T4likevirus-type, N-terminal
MPLSRPQEIIAQDQHRWKVVIAGRRFGKTHLAIRELCFHARLPDQEVWYVAPTYKQAKMIVWRKLKNKLTDLKWVKKANESELSILLKNGSTIALKGADNEDSLRGVGLDYLIMDEFADIDPEAFFEVLRPTLADRQGKAMFIGTPKGIANWAYDLYQMEQEYPEDWKSFQFTTIDGGNVTESEIEAARRDLDIRQFRQEFLATFETYTGRIYYAFDRAQNVKKPDNLDTSVLYTGWDFNIDPMSVVIAVRQGDTLYVIDEIRMFSSNTQEAVEEIKSRYPKSKIWAYPDPAARQRKTSAGGATDITILSNAGFVVKAPNSHTPVRDRINAVNSRLCDSTGVRRLIISPECKYTIEGLERQTYKEGTTQPDKDSGYDHQMDALGYMVDYMFPVKRDVDPMAIVPQRWGHNIGTRR